MPSASPGIRCAAISLRTKRSIAANSGPAPAPLAAGVSEPGLVTTYAAPRTTAASAAQIAILRCRGLQRPIQPACSVECGSASGGAEEDRGLRGSSGSFWITRVLIAAPTAVRGYRYARSGGSASEAGKLVS